MTSLRRLSRRLRHQGRFRLAVVLTIVVACYVAVPPVARFVDSVAGYNPTHYEPKDFERQEWLRHQDPDSLLATVSWQTVVNLVLFALVAAVWLTLLPPRSPRRRVTPPR